MATDSARQQRSSETPADGILSRTVSQLRQFLCGLHGHDALLHFDHGRISLLCTSCGYESPGWDVKGVPARREEQVEPRRLVRLPLVRERRVA